MKGYDPPGITTESDKLQVVFEQQEIDRKNRHIAVSFARTEALRSKATEVVEGLYMKMESINLQELSEKLEIHENILDPVLRSRGYKRTMGPDGRFKKVVYDLDSEGKLRRQILILQDTNNELRRKLLSLEKGEKIVRDKDIIRKRKTKTG